VVDIGEDEMMGRTVLVAFATFLLLSGFLGFNVKPASGGTIVVPDNYPTIQAALNAAVAADTVFVRSGTYFERIVISKAVSLIGENKTTTIIDGSMQGTVVEITVSNVKVCGFTIRNGYISSSSLASGVVLNPRSSNVQGVNVSGNIIMNSNGGVYFYSNPYYHLWLNFVSFNKFENVCTAISVYGSHNIVRGNTILDGAEASGNSWTRNPVAVVTYGWNNTIVENLISRNDDGIIAQSSPYGPGTYVVQNLISNCSGDGLRFFCSNGVVDGNVMMNNSVGFLLEGTNNYIANNFISSNRFGFQILGGSGNVLRNNTMTDNVFNDKFVNFGFGYGLLDLFSDGPPSLPTLIQDVDTSNTVNGKPIYYLVNKKDEVVSGETGCVVVANSSGMIIKDLKITENTQGVIVAYSSDSSIHNVSASRFEVVACDGLTAEYDYGAIRLWNSTNCRITNNNGTTATLGFCNNNIIDNNLDMAITLSTSEGNIIHDNHDCSVNVQSFPPRTDLIYPSRNNTITSNTLNSIRVWLSCNNTISNNTITGPFWGGIREPTYGIRLTGAYNNSVKNNAIEGFNAGIVCEDRTTPSIKTENNTFTGNIISNNTVGLLLTSKDNTLKENAFIDNKYSVSGDELLNNDADTLNTVNGNPIYLLVNQTGLVINPSTYPNIGYLALSGCADIVVENLTFVNNCEGLLLHDTKNVTVTGCVMKDNVIGLKVGGLFNNIINNTIINNQQGITISDQGGSNTVNANTIRNNTYHNLAPEDPYLNSGYGIPVYLQSVLALYESGGVSIRSYNNTITSNVITDNERGIVLWGGENTFRDNTLTANKLNFCFSEIEVQSYLTQLIQDMDASNLIEGKPAYYWINQQNKQVPEDAGLVVLVNCTNITVKNLNITNERIGILLAGTNNTIITNATIKNCLYGIFIRNVQIEEQPEPLISSFNNTIANCTLTDNGAGITLYGVNLTSVDVNLISKNMMGLWLYDGSYNTIKGNVIINNTIYQYYYGLSPAPFPEGEVPRPIGFWHDWGSIVLEGRFNNITENTIAYNDIGLSVGLPIFGSPGENWIYNNNFINNTEQLWVGSYNFWDNGYPQGGNYFSDYTGTDNYSGPDQNEANPDGIGDAPFDLAKWWSILSLPPGETEAKRWAKYPLMKPYGEPHDLGLKLSMPKTVIPQGYNIGTINVTIINYGLETENSSFTLQIVATNYTQTITLTSRDSTTLTFQWNTTNLPKGNYTISAQISPVLGETDTSDNALTCTLTITIPGDYTGDGTVNYDDVDLLRLSWQSHQGQANYNPNVDFNMDGIVNIADVAAISLNWQKHA
jgi:parallel beta-helix repeat protein